MADINKTVKAVQRQENSSNRLFDAANALIRNVNNAGTNTAALDKYQSQIGELNTKIQQQIAVLNTLRSDLASGGIDTTNMSHRMAKESVDAFLDLMQDRSRELGKLPATIAQARGAARQESTATPPATTARAKRGEKVNTGPPVTASFDPEIAAAATAGIAEISIPEPAAPPASIPSASPIARASAPKRSTAPKPAAPPPAPSPPPTTLGPKFSVISREEAMAGSAPVPKPPKPPKPPKTAKPAAKPATPPPTVPPIDGGTTTGGDDEEDDTLSEAFGPYGPGFSRRREASRLRALGETLGPQVAAITAAGGFRDTAHEQEITGAVGGYARSSGLFRTTFGVPRYHARASQLQKELAGVPTTLGDPTARNRFQGIEDQYRSMLSRPMHPDDVFAFGEQIRQEKAGLAQDASLNPQQRGQLMQQLSGYETGIRNLGNVTPIAPGSRGSALSRQTLAGASVAQGIYARNTEMERGGVTDSRREEMRDQIAAGRQMLQIAEQRLRIAHEQAELEGRVTREMQHQYESAQREIGALGGRLGQQEKDLGGLRTTSTGRGQMEDLFEGRLPSIGSALRNYARTTGRPMSTLQSGVLGAMDHPLGFGMGAIQAGGLAAGRAIGGAVSGGGAAATQLGGELGAGAAIPIGGIALFAISAILSQMGNATRHGMGVENLYRRGGFAGTGETNVGGGASIFRTGLYDTVLQPGQALSYSRDESLQMAQLLASGGMHENNQLTRGRMQSALEFSRYQGVDIGATGSYISGMQRAGIGLGEGGQSQLLNGLSQAIRQGNMGGRESEVMESISRLTQSLASQGVAGAAPRIMATETLLNRQENPLLRGEYGATALGNLSQGIQGAQGYQQALLYNFARQRNPRLSSTAMLYEQAKGTSSEYMPDFLKGFLGMARGNTEDAGVLMHATMPSVPLLQAKALLDAASKAGPEGLTSENVQRVLQDQATSGPGYNALGMNAAGNTQPVTQQGRFEELNSTLIDLQNTLENTVANLTPAVDKIIGLFVTLSKAAEGISALGNMGDAVSGALSQFLPRLPGVGGGPSANARPNLSPDSLPPGSSINKIGVGPDDAGQITSQGSASAIVGTGGGRSVSRIHQTYGNTCSAATLVMLFQQQTGVTISEEEAAGALGITPDRSGRLPGLSWNAVPGALEKLNAKYGTQVQAQRDSGNPRAALDQSQPFMFSVNEGLGVYDPTTGAKRDPTSGVFTDHIMGAVAAGNGTFNLFDPASNTMPGGQAGGGLQNLSREQLSRLIGGASWTFSNPAQSQGSATTPLLGSLNTNGGVTGGNDARGQIIGEATQTYGARAGRVIAAILSQEGGLSGARGDNGQAFGPFQMEGGKLADFGQSVGISDLQQAGVYAEQHPTEAAHWAMTHYMSSALSQAGNLSDTDLMTTVLRGGRRGEGQNAGAATGSSAYYDRLREVQQSGEVPESYVNQPMMGQDLAASQQMMRLSFAPASIAITLDGQQVGTGELVINPMQDALASVDREGSSGFSGATI